MSEACYVDDVIVIVPTHLEMLEEDQAMVLRHNAQVLSDYPIEIVLPNSCAPDWYEAFFAREGINGTVRLVKSEYFGSAAAVNKMGTDPMFYRLYQSYKYMLICHLDAWLFEDQLTKWIARDDDFIGAPLFLPDVGRGHFMRRMAPYGCNGGLSLRRIDTCIRVLEDFRPGFNFFRVIQAVWFLARNRRFDFIVILWRLLRLLWTDWQGTCIKYNIYEDVFFTIIAPMMGARIKVTPSHVAMRFSCEVNYDQIQKERLGQTPPFGIHGIDKYICSDQLIHWQRYFERKRQTYDAELLPKEPKVSIVMIVKDLIKNGRLETFDQSLSSVAEQTYRNKEIVIVDGGSDDATFETLKHTYKHISNIVFYRKADNSVWEGMSNGVDFATGDLIAVMNSDDYYMRLDALELLVSELVTRKADWVFGDTKLLLEDGGEIVFPTHLPAVLNCFGIVHQACLIKKSAIEAIAPFKSGHITAENYLFVALLAQGYRWSNVSELIVCYRTGGLSSELYSGVNFDRAVADYTQYMQKLTSVGYYLLPEQIAELYGFQGIRHKGFRFFISVVWSIKDHRLRFLFFQALVRQIRAERIERLIVRKFAHLIRRYIK